MTTGKDMKSIRAAVEAGFAALQGDSSPSLDELRALKANLDDYRVAVESREEGLRSTLTSLVDDMGRTSEKLTETGLRLEGILEAAEDVAFVIHRDDDTRGIIEFSAGAQHIFGYARDEILGCSVNVLCAEGGPGKHGDCGSGMSANRARFRRRSGEIFPGLYSLHQLRKGEGQSLGSLLIVLDVSKRELAERVLRETQQQYKALLTASPISIMAFDAQGTITLVNDWHLHRIDRDRLSPEFYIGKKLWDIPGVIRAGLGERLRGVLRGRTVSLEDVIIPAFGDREEVCQNFRCAPVMEGDVVTGGILIREDVTRRKRTERDLKLLIDSSPITIVKLELTPHGRIIRSLNPAGLEMFGRQALGRPLSDYVTRLETGPVSAPVPEESCEVLSPRGRLLAVRTRHRPSPEYEIQAIMDVTDLLRAKKAAEDASQAKSDFLANISHEIRTPLNGLLGMLQLFKDSELPGDLAEMADYAFDSARSLLILLNDILDFSVVEARAVELDEKPVNLAEIVDVVIGPYSLEASSKGVALNWLADASLPQEVCADARRLRQVLFHLVGNAMKFTDAGDVSVSACLLPATVRGRRGKLLFLVRDSGIGISPDKLGVIFELFRQGDGSRTRRHGGTGIGLSLVRRFVQAMNGTVCISTEPGQGTEIAFTVEVGL